MIHRAIPVIKYIWLIELPAIKYTWYIELFLQWNIHEI